MIKKILKGVGMCCRCPFEDCFSQNWYYNTLGLLKRLIKVNRIRTPPLIENQSLAIGLEAMEGVNCTVTYKNLFPPPPPLSLSRVDKRKKKISFID